MITSDKTSEFQSTRPMRGATLVSCEPCRNETFQSTRPMRGATWASRNGYIVPDISIHAPHAGRDEKRPCPPSPDRISIHAPHAGRDFAGSRGSSFSVISIHAPHAGRDLSRCGRPLFRPISIHAPHAGRDKTGFPSKRCRPLFQSTRPMRGATAAIASGTMAQRYFNPLAPCGARPRCISFAPCSNYFNPRAPCGARPPP